MTLDREGKTRVHDRYVVSAPVAGRCCGSSSSPAIRSRRGDRVATFVPAASPLLDARTRAEAAVARQRGRGVLAQARAPTGAGAGAARPRREERDRAANALPRSGGVAVGHRTAKRREGRGESAHLRRSMPPAQPPRRASRATSPRRARPAGLGRRAPGASHDAALHAPVDGVVLSASTRASPSCRRANRSSRLPDPAARGHRRLPVDRSRADPRRHAGDGRPLGRHPAAARGGAPRRTVGFLKVSALGVEEQRVDVILGIGTRCRDVAIARRRLPRRGARRGVGAPRRAEGARRARSSAADRTAAVLSLSENGRAGLRTVTIGERTGVEAQVVGGLAAGDRAISPSVGFGGRRRARRAARAVKILPAAYEA